MAAKIYVNIDELSWSVDVLVALRVGVERTKPRRLPGAELGESVPPTNGDDLPTYNIKTKLLPWNGKYD